MAGNGSRKNTTNPPPLHILPRDFPQSPVTKSVARAGAHPLEGGPGPAFWQKPLGATAPPAGVKCIALLGLLGLPRGGQAVTDPGGGCGGGTDFGRQFLARARGNPAPGRRLEGEKNGSGGGQDSLRQGLSNFPPRARGGGDIPRPLFIGARVPKAPRGPGHKTLRTHRGESWAVQNKLGTPGRFLTKACPAGPRGQNDGAVALLPRKAPHDQKALKIFAAA